MPIDPIVRQPFRLVVDFVWARRNRPVGPYRSRSMKGEVLETNKAIGGMVIAFDRKDKGAACVAHAGGKKIHRLVTVYDLDVGWLP